MGFGIVLQAECFGALLVQLLQLAANLPVVGRHRRRRREGG